MYLSAFLLLEASLCYYEGLTWDKSMDLQNLVIKIVSEVLLKTVAGKVLLSKWEIKKGSAGCH